MLEAKMKDGKFSLTVDEVRDNAVVKCGDTVVSTRAFLMNGARVDDTLVINEGIVALPRHAAAEVAKSGNPEAAKERKAKRKAAADAAKAEKKASKKTKAKK